MSSAVTNPISSRRCCKKTPWGRIVKKKTRHAGRRGNTAGCRETSPARPAEPFGELEYEVDVDVSFQRVGELFELYLEKCSVVDLRAWDSKLRAC